MPFVAFMVDDGFYRINQKAVLNLLKTAFFVITLSLYQGTFCLFASVAIHQCGVQFDAFHTFF